MSRCPVLAPLEGGKPAEHEADRVALTPGSAEADIRQPGDPVHLALGDLEPARGASPEQVFLRSWAETILEEALGDLRQDLSARGRGIVFETFREYCLEDEPGQDSSYLQIARKLGLSEADVTNYLAESRRELRRILIGKIGATAGCPREVDEEFRTLFGSR